MANLEAQLKSEIDRITREIAEKNLELQEVIKDMEDYKKNKSVIERLLSKATGKKPRKPRTPKLKA